MKFNIPVVIQFGIDLQQGLPSAEIDHIAMAINGRTIIDPAGYPVVVLI